MFFKTENAINTDPRHWEIYDINNGIKCVHASGEYEDYFEYDEIEALNAFEGTRPMSVLDLFNRLMSVTPRTKGFAYNDFNIIAKIDKLTQRPKGFVIRSRLHDQKEDMGVENVNHKESYVSTETLKATNVKDFVDIIFLQNKKDDKLQQILDTEN